MAYSKSRHPPPLTSRFILYNYLSVHLMYIYAMLCHVHVNPRGQYSRVIERLVYSSSYNDGVDDMMWVYMWQFWEQLLAIRRGRVGGGSLFSLLLGGVSQLVRSPYCMGNRRLLQYRFEWSVEPSLRLHDVT